MGKQTANKNNKKELAPKDAGIKKNTPKKGKHVSSGADEIDDIFSKKKITDASEIDDIFNTKKIKGDKKQEDEQLEEEEEGEEAEELTEEQAKKVEEVVFAELAAVKNSNTSKTKKRAAPPPPADDAFADSRGLKKTNRTTDDGYPLYDVKDLNIGNGLDTPDCPFDCQCCF